MHAIDFTPRAFANDPRFTGVVKGVDHSPASDRRLHAFAVASEPGTAVWTEPGEEHWHGALPGTSMTHIAVQTADPAQAEVIWLEPVADATAGADRP
ncbi:cupin domain-containing protein [Nakamurella lactea]|uniref:hypothetical protein n=1 Tax=Nakamurella lactea TaxID=459515 RepID=UPI000408300F|nr:hypothetical protein [Nakamurella lactea]